MIWTRIYLNEKKLAAVYYYSILLKIITWLENFENKHDNLSTGPGTNTMLKTHIVILFLPHRSR